MTSRENQELFPSFVKRKLMKKPIKRERHLYTVSTQCFLKDITKKIQYQFNPHQLDV